MSAAAEIGTSVPNQSPAPNAGQPGAAPASAPAGAPAAPAHWSAALEGLPDETKEWIGKKTYTNAQQALVGFHNLERLRGLPADRLVELPASDDPEAWNKVYERLGRPASADEYKFEGVDEEQAKELPLLPKFKQLAHAAGVNPKQANALFQGYQAMVSELENEQAAEFERTSAAEFEQTKRKWGAAADAKIDAFKRFAQATGWGRDAFEAIERAWGTGVFLERMSQLGERLGEARGLRGDGTGETRGILTPAQAQEEFNALLKNPDFIKRRLEGDPKAEKQYQQLAELAASGG